MTPAPTSSTGSKSQSGGRDSTTSTSLGGECGRGPSSANGPAGKTLFAQMNKSGTTSSASSSSSSLNKKNTTTSMSPGKILARNLALEKLNALGRYKFEEDFDFDAVTDAASLTVLDSRMEIEQQEADEQQGAVAEEAIIEAGGAGVEPEGGEEEQDENDVENNEDRMKIRSTRIYPLKKTYALYFQDAFSILGAKKSGKYDEGLVKVCEMKTVQDFYRVWNNLQEGLGCLSLFKKGVRPLWEDKANANGGRWVLSQTGAQERMKFFTEMALAMIGGHFGKEVEAEGDEILGVSFHLYKKAWKIEMWNKNGAADTVRAVDLKLRQILQVGDRDAFSIKYASHDGKRTETYIGTQEDAPQERM